MTQTPWFRAEPRTLDPAALFDLLASPPAILSDYDALLARLRAADDLLREARVAVEQDSWGVAVDLLDRIDAHLCGVPPVLPDQPAPVPGSGDVWAEVIAWCRTVPSLSGLVPLMEERRAVGIARYGVPLQRDNGRDHRADAVQELLDAVAYLWADGGQSAANDALYVLLHVAEEE